MDNFVEMSDNTTLTTNNVSLKEFVVTLFNERAKAIDVAQTSLNTRLEGMNQFRDQLTNQAARFITREEHDTLNRTINATQLQLQSFSGTFVTRDEAGALNNTIEKLRDTLNTMAGRTQILTQIITGSIAGLAVLVSILSFIYNSNSHTDSTLTQKVDTLTTAFQQHIQADTIRDRVAIPTINLPLTK